MIADVLGAAWSSFVATWNYLLGIPLAAAQGLLFSTIVVVGIALLIWLFKRSVALLVVVGPVIVVVIAFVFGGIGQWTGAGFFSDLMKIGSIIAFMWAVAALVLTMFVSRPPRK